MDESTLFSADAAEDQMAEAREQIDQGRTRFPGLSYEEGVVAALEWALGQNETIPYPES